MQAHAPKNARGSSPNKKMHIAVINHKQVLGDEDYQLRETRLYSAQVTSASCTIYHLPH